MAGSSDKTAPKNTSSEKAKSRAKSHFRIHGFSVPACLRMRQKLEGMPNPEVHFRGMSIRELMCHVVPLPMLTPTFWKA